MMTKFLLTMMSAAVVAVASAHSHPKNDDPNRIISGAESIDRRLRQNTFLRRGAKQSPSSERDLHVVQSEYAQWNPDLKIIGGTPSATNRYPYLASLTYSGSHLCGGSLVAKDMILTAAHCAGYTSEIELGRYDKMQPFDNNMHEKIAVAYEIKHPGWKPPGVDQDFMLLKLVRPSEKFPLVTLNTDPNLPSIPGEQLTLMGWGDTNIDPDISSPSMVLLEIQLEYIPNDTCRAKQGTVDGTSNVVDYSQRLTDNMMCAMDEDGGRGDLIVDEDTCVGDSGGPMILPGSPDKQVGIVSWGIGCASPIFPGVYSRISSQYEWIRETVCNHTSYAPESFQCGNSGGAGGSAFLQDDAPPDGKKYVTLEVSLDEQPEEFSWVVSTIEGESSRMVASVPPHFYAGYVNYTFHHKLEVNPNQFYRISLRDKFGDGLKGYVAVYRGSVPILNNLIMYESLFYDKDSTDNKRIDHAFYTGEFTPAYFSLAIRFDKYPKDVWWKLESETDGVILAQRPPGWYNERFALMSIVEKIPAFGARPNVPSYRFTIGDSYPCDGNPSETCGDGICCNYGDGKFELYAWSVEENLLLFSGGEYGLTDEILITATEAFAAVGR